MRKRLCACILSLLLIITVWINIRLLLNNDKYYRNQVVKVIACDECGKPMWHGTGTVIRKDGLIITAGHVVEGASKFKVLFMNGFVTEAVVAYIPQHSVDIAFLDIKGYGYKNIGFDTPVFDSAIFVTGCPFNLDFVTVKGRVASLNVDNPFFGDDLFCTQIVCLPGNSGSAVFDSSGDIIGLLIGGWDTVDGLNICVSTESVQNIIYSIEDKI